MKRVLVLLISLFAFSINVYAADINVSLSGSENVDANSSFEINVTLSGNNIWGFNSNLNYDKNKLELVESAGQNGFTATVGDKIVLDSSSGHNGSFIALVLKFKCKSSFVAGDKTTISLTNGKGATDSSKLTSSDASKVISVNKPKSSNNDLSKIIIDGNLISGFSSDRLNYSVDNIVNNKINIDAVKFDSKATISGTGQKNLKYGKNTFTITVTAENGSKKDYTIIVNRKDNRNSNNNLSTLTISPININFKSNVTSYSVIVENNVNKITINATPEDSTSSVTGTGNKTLSNYENVFNVVVTAQNETKKTYTIKVIRKDENGNLSAMSSDNYLKSLTITGYELSPSFDKNILEYSLFVDNITDTIEIIAVPNDSKSNVRVNNKEKLEVGLNVIDIEVSSESKETRDYKLNVTRKSDINEATMDSLVETIKKTSSNVIDVKSNDNNVITSEILNVLKENNKKLNVNYYNDTNQLLYSWTIDGSKIKEESNIKTEIKFETDKKEAIDKITNYSNSIYLKFSHSGNLPENTSVKVYVGDKYNENDLVNVYYYNEEKNIMEEISLNHKVQNGYIVINIDHCSNYIITKAILNNDFISSKYIIIIIIESILLIISAFYLIQSKVAK